MSLSKSWTTSRGLSATNRPVQLFFKQCFLTILNWPKWDQVLIPMGQRLKFVSLKCCALIIALFWPARFELCLFFPLLNLILMRNPQIQTPLKTALVLHSKFTHSQVFGEQLAVTHTYRGTQAISTLIHQRSSSDVGLSALTALLWFFIRKRLCWLRTRSTADKFITKRKPFQTSKWSGICFIAVIW